MTNVEAGKIARIGALVTVRLAPPTDYPRTCAAMGTGQPFLVPYGLYHGTAEVELFPA